MQYKKIKDFRKIKQKFNTVYFLSTYVLGKCHKMSTKFENINKLFSILSQSYPQTINTVFGVPLTHIFYRLSENDSVKMTTQINNNCFCRFVNSFTKSSILSAICLCDKFEFCNTFFFN